MKRFTFLAAAAVMAAAVFVACQKNGGEVNNGGGQTDPVRVTGVTIAGDDLVDGALTLDAGQTSTLRAVVAPDDAENKAVTWNSESDGIASVDQSGVVTAIGEGTTTITVTTTDGSHEGSVEVTVNPTGPVRVTGVSLNKTNHKMSAGETFQLIATVEPVNAANKNVIWESLTLDAIAEIDNNGLVTAHSRVTNGTVQMKVRTEDGDYEAICTFTLEGTMINGLRWADRNVAAAGTFVEKESDTGHYYQWGINVSWNGSGTNWTSSDGSAWDDSGKADATWDPTADPCPAGYRLPTTADFKKLWEPGWATAQDAPVEVYWMPSNEVSGAMFVDAASRKALFFPAAGSLAYFSAMNMFLANGPGTNGMYWAGDTEAVGKGYRVAFNQMFGDNPLAIGVDSWGSAATNNAYQIRCVMVDQPE